ncbi:putative C6 transcription factor [Lophiostoma macrostomum CBS 122681]|uniref:Putative C6 transcription factor n=1 Tax=Lophiostoma macrostomum CBS 122681 TaxID=1314788 RepID=A0A6A6SZ66_9PLEO|nr:putative C6 transcription factor [Lophiostoma macrostomum CBS 122681]
MATSSRDSQRFRPLLPQLSPPIPSSPIPGRCHGNTVAGTQATSQRVKIRKPPYEQLFDLMRSAPEQDARDILKRLRSGVDVETLISHVADGDLLLQLSVAPETRYRYDFPYVSTMPASLVTNDNPYLQSFIYEAATIYPSPEQLEVPQQSPSSLEASPGPYPHGAELAKYGPIYQKPFQAAVVIEPLLSQVHISSWTSVCQDDELMRSLLSIWLHCEYHFTAALQKDLFLEDMAAQREDFCSSLLVNIILAYACICYPRFKNRAHYWDPQTLTYRFLAEAKRLWELEAGRPRITTIQAGLLFNVFYNLSGLDEVGQAYRIQAIALANSMHLFSSSAFQGQSAKIRNGMAYAAWALFNWETLVGFSFMFAPLLSKQPDWDLPDPSKDSQWYGEVWVKYPMSNHLLPLHFGQVFRATSSFRIIMNEVCQAAYSGDPGISLRQAREFLSRLKAWFGFLPECLTPKSIVLPGHLQLHMYYHHLILTIFRPLLDEELDQGPSPQHIVDDASRYLQTLIRLYYIRHGYEAMDLFIVIPLVLAAYDCLDAINEQTPPTQLESLRSTLILAAKGLYSQRMNHYLADALFRVIRGRMRPAEVSLFKGMMNLDEGELDKKPDMGQAVRSHWPITVVKNKKDVESYVLANLVENYAHLNLEAAADGPSDNIPS